MTRPYRAFRDCEACQDDAESVGFLTRYDIVEMFVRSSTMKSKNWTILILISLCLCAQQTLAQTAPKTVVEEIIIKAKDFNLGRPRSESPDPRQTPTPRN